MESTRDLILTAILSNSRVFGSIRDYHAERADTLLEYVDGYLNDKCRISVENLWGLMLPTSIGTSALNPHNLESEDYEWLALKLKALVVRSVNNPEVLTAGHYVCAVASSGKALDAIGSYYAENYNHYRNNRRRILSDILQRLVDKSGVGSAVMNISHLNTVEMVEAMLAIKRLAYERLDAKRGRVTEVPKPIDVPPKIAVGPFIESVGNAMGADAATVFDAILNCRQAHEYMCGALERCKLFYYGGADVNCVKWSIITAAIREMPMGEQRDVLRAKTELSTVAREGLGHHLREHFREIVTGEVLDTTEYYKNAAQQHLNDAEEYLSNANQLYVEAIMATKYADKAIAKPTLVFGIDTEDMGEAQFLSAIRQVTHQIESYADIKDSKAIDEKVSALKETRKELVALLDAAASK